MIFILITLILTQKNITLTQRNIII